MLSDLRLKVVPPAGFEPATVGLEVRCSVQLSYEGLAGPMLLGSRRWSEAAGPG